MNLVGKTMEQKDIKVLMAGIDSNGDNSGQVRIYKNVLGTWIQTGSNINGEAAGDLSGWSVSMSLDSSTIAIASPYNDENGLDSGHVRVYDLSSTLSSNDFVLSKFSLYPNPTKNQFTIQLQEGLELLKVNIYNSLGQFISSTTKRIVDTTGLSSGLYYVEVITNQGKATKKLIIN